MCTVCKVGISYAEFPINAKGFSKDGFHIQVTERVEEPIYLITEAPGLYEAIHKAFTWLADYKGIRMREERRIPEMFRYLGWCSWDAFYKEVSEAGIRQKADEFAEKKIPMR